MKHLVIFKGNKFNLLTKGFSTEIQPWLHQESRIAKLRGELVLSDHSHIEKYAINLVRSYFRTTNKDAVSLDSSLKSHGLDSIDSLELCV